MKHIKFSFYYKIIVIIAIIAINNIAYAKTQPLTITTGIIPIGSLVSMLNSNTDNEINVVLANPNVSPHDSAINVKEMQAIKNSDVLILVSKNFEQEIIPNIDTTKTTVIYLDELLGVSQDYHFWLDTTMTQKILKVLAVELGKIDPNNAKIFQSNALKYSSKIEGLKKEMQVDLSLVKNNFMVYHNAWNYFIRDNNLLKYYQGSITKENEHHHDIDTTLGVQDIIKLGEDVKQKNIVCILTEPQFEDSTINNFIAKNHIRTAELNPIGKITSPLADSYFLMMKENAKQLKSCVNI
ncbi:MAG: metal ABC transporter substrate-binding protein [Alphaproteobacteria bacterium]|jgi:zinc transport system substrate-binding protein|nr:metal ABC transporter substrate-binding protein [Alphaproteobacteria bacterium]